MATTPEQQNALHTSHGYRVKIKEALAKVCANIAFEGDAVDHHAQRNALANSVALDPDKYVPLFAWATAAMAEILPTIDGAGDNIKTNATQDVIIQAVSNIWNLFAIR
jgi:hypothetical protein